MKMAQSSGDEVTYLLNDLKHLAVVALRDDELVHVLLPLDVHRTQDLQVLLPNRLLPEQLQQGFSVSLGENPVVKCLIHSSAP